MPVLLIWICSSPDKGSEILLVSWGEVSLFFFGIYLLTRDRRENVPIANPLVHEGPMP